VDPMQAPTFAGTGQDQYRSCGSWSARVSGTTWMGVPTQEASRM
jgi:hypothetical protein